jgi:hypothetical protein
LQIGSTELTKLKMKIKVSIKYELWPYEQELSVTIPQDEFHKMDTYVDSMTSNLKMNLLTHVKNHHPNTWYKNSPLNLDKLKDLQNDAN